MLLTLRNKRRNTRRTNNRSGISLLLLLPILRALRQQRQKCHRYEEQRMAIDAEDLVPILIALRLPNVLLVRLGRDGLVLALCGVRFTVGA